MKSKLLVLGGSGLVGSTVINYAKNDYDIIFSYNNNKINIPNTQSFQIDLLDNNEIETIIQNYDPDIVLHTIAHSSVDLCETNHEIADKLHVDATQKIVNVCKKIDSKLIFLSTDAVFEGQLNKQYNENDFVNPVNYYGKTKLKAEKIVLNASPNNVVLRTSVIYGWHKKSRFSNWIIETLKEKRSVDPYIDQYNTPTLVDDLTKSILKIIKMNISGLYHATGKTCMNRFEFASLIADIFNFDKNLISPVTSLEKKQLAPRPKHSCLDSSLLEKTINFRFNELSSGIQFILKRSQTT